MKTLKYSLVLIFALLISGPGCKKFDLDTNDLTLSANLSIFRTMVNFTYFNAATGAPITLTPSTKLRIEVVSPVNGLIVNSGSGEFQTTFYSNYALCSFALNPYSVLPTHEKPISILVKTTLDKYMENYFTIDLAEERNYNQEIKLINLVEPPVGVIIEDHKNAGKTSGSGETKEPINIGTKDSTVSVTIEQGTILRDESGQPLSGNVSVEMMTVDVSTPEGILNVPALSQPLRTEDGTLSALFNPVAYSRVQITDDAGHKAATVTGKDMVITTSLNPTIMNPRTRKPVTEGDLVPCYYFNGREGSWKFFGQDTVTRENGKLLLVKIIRSKKSTGDENFSEITYSFDQNSPVDLQLNINLPATKPTVPTGFNVVVKGFDYLGTPTVLFNNGITVFTNNTRFTINNLNADYVSYSIPVMVVE